MGKLTPREEPRDALEIDNRHEREDGHKDQKVDLGRRRSQGVDIVPVGNCPPPLAILSLVEPSPIYHWRMHTICRKPKSHNCQEDLDSAQDENKTVHFENRCFLLTDNKAQQITDSARLAARYSKEWTVGGLCRERVSEAATSALDEGKLDKPKRVKGRQESPDEQTREQLKKRQMGRKMISVT